MSGADDLEILNPDHPVLIGGEFWTVREYSHVEDARYFGMGRKAIASIDRLSGHQMELIHMLNLSTGRSAERIAGLSEDDFARLVREWRELNGPHFNLKPRRKKAGKPERLGARYAVLLAMGHRLEQIRGYTLRQLELFAECGYQVSDQRRADFVIDANLAQHGGKATNEHIGKLRRD